MDFAWFVYTVAIMMVAMVACSMAVMEWVLAQRRDSLAAAACFALYVLDVGIVLYDEYIQAKLLPGDYFAAGLTHPAFQVVEGVALMLALWCWALLWAGVHPQPRMVALAGLLLLGANAALAPAAGAGPLRTFAFWAFRDVAVIAALAWLGLRGGIRQSGAQRPRFAWSQRAYLVTMALAVATLAEDAYTILVSQPDLQTAWARSLYLHLTERNICENALMVWLALLLVAGARSTMAVYARHPAHDERLTDDRRVRPDFDRRLLAFADEHGMSAREREVLSLVLQGKDTQNVASELTISTGTVKAHMHRIYRKAGVSSRQELLSAFWHS